MPLTFDEEKATQAAAMFLRLRGGQMSYMKLIKLLYLADRTALLRYGKPITMDRWYSMKYGPVLSNVLDLIKSTESEGPWSRFISAPTTSREVTLLENDVPNSRLSQAEERIIEEIFQRYGSLGRFDLVNLLHDGEIAPEWKEPRLTGSVLIELRDILTQEMSPEEAKQVEAELLSLAS